MRREYDVIIIGAGPSGLSCAIELQQTGRTVLVLEKNKEIGPKVCAGGLTPKIESIGLPLGIADILFSSIKINVPGKAKIYFDDRPFFATIGRSKLGKILLKKLSKEIEIRVDSEVTEIDSDFIKTKGQRIKYKYLVGADGSSSIVRRFLGLKTNKFLITFQYIVPQEFKHLELFYDAFLFGLGYAWIFPHKGYASIGCSSDGRFVKAPELKNNFEKWLRDRNINVKNAELQSDIINFDYQGFDFGNKFLVGDAAGVASGLSGEGIYFGMVSGREVAKKIVDPFYKCEKISKILKIKYAHERSLKFTLLLMSLNKSLLNSYFKLYPFLINSKSFTE